MPVQKAATGYLHGFTAEEQSRLRRQARFLSYKVHDQLPFRRCRQLIEVGCGVGAQTEILLRHFPDLHVTGIDASDANLRPRVSTSRAWAGRRTASTCSAWTPRASTSAQTASTAPSCAGSSSTSATRCRC